MDLWIRSQKNDDLRQGLFKVKEIELGDYHEKYDSLVVNNLYCVGRYKTKERALEVLDEIQSKIAILNYQRHYLNKKFNLIESNVYQMPID